MTTKELKTYPVAVQKEYRRIAKGPHEGTFTLLHHEGPAVENTHDVVERLDYILCNKAASEHLARLRNIAFVPAAIWAEYDKAVQAARAEGDKAMQAAWAEYDKAVQAAWAECGKAAQPAWARLCKQIKLNSTWNGRSIFA